MYKNNNTSDEYSDYLRDTIVGSSLVVMVSIFGMMGNCLLIYVLNHSPYFKYKSYHLLKSLAAADFLTSFSFFFWYGIIIFQYANIPRFTKLPLLVWSIPDAVLTFATTVSLTNNLAIAVDRLIFVGKPLFHITRLGIRYVYTLVGFAWLPMFFHTFLIDFGVFFTSVDDPLAFGSLDEFLNNIFCSKMWCNEQMGLMLTLSALIVLVYLAMIPVGRKALAKTIKSMMACGTGPNEFMLPIRPSCIMDRKKKLEERLLRVALALVFFFILTMILSTGGRLVLESVNLDLAMKALPYANLLLALNSSCSFLVTTWQDDIFRRSVINLISRRSSSFSTFSS